MPFITADNLKEYTGVHDGPIQSFVDAATSIVQNYLGYELGLRTYTTTRNGNGIDELQLKARPIKEILRVVINGTDVPVNWFETSNEFIYHVKGIFPPGKRNITVVYNAGFDVDIFAPESDVFDGGDSANDADDFIGDADAAFISPILDGGDALLRDGRNAIPPEIVNAILRIAALLQTESDGNIGITGKSFSDSGSRSFVSFTNFDKYLQPISAWKLVRI